MCWLYNNVFFLVFAYIHEKMLKKIPQFSTKNVILDLVFYLVLLKSQHKKFPKVPT